MLLKDLYSKNVGDTSSIDEYEKRLSEARKEAMKDKRSRTQRILCEVDVTDPAKLLEFCCREKTASVHIVYCVPTEQLQAIFHSLADGLEERLYNVHFVNFRTERGGIWTWIALSDTQEGKIVRVGSAFKEINCTRSKEVKEFIDMMNDRAEREKFIHINDECEYRDVTDNGNNEN